MWDVIDQLKFKVEAQRPLHPEMMRTITQKFREEWTYHSNAIEGNTFTHQETAFFLREGLTVKGKSLREHLEIVNHAEAIDYLADVLRERELSERLIKDFHAILFQRVKDISFTIGEYKQADNHVLTISGNIHHYCPYLFVPQEMEFLIEQYTENIKQKHPIEVAAVFHHKFVAIHPFTDGNGRVGRIAMNVILMKHGYPPAIIRNENRLAYYQALEQADGDNIQPMVEMITSEVEKNLKMMVSAMQLD